VAVGYRFRGTYEWLRRRPGRAENWWRTSIAAAEQCGLRYELAESCNELGRRTGDVGARARGTKIHAGLAAERALVSAKGAE
jgi:hypothetical protein